MYRHTARFSKRAPREKRTMQWKYNKNVKIYTEKSRTTHKYLEVTNDSKTTRDTAQLCLENHADVFSVAQINYSNKKYCN